jgi:acetyltransferase
MRSLKIKNLNKVFNPKTVAIIGATEREQSVGLGIIKNLALGEDERKIFYVNPFKKEVLGIECYPKVSAIKQAVDLAVIAIPADSVLEVIQECIIKKVGGIIVITGNFGESGEEGKKLEEKIKKAIENTDIPLIGPNCLGILNPSVKLSASFAPLMPKIGNIAFLSQSGAMVDAVLDKAARENFGFSKIVSYGNELDMQLDELLEYLKNDRETKTIAVYLEAIKDGPGFMKIAKEISKVKPVVAIKAGKGVAGQKAALTHTGALSTDYEIYKAVFKQAGIIQADSLDDLTDAVKALSFQPRCQNGIGIITNGGGLGVLATDFCEASGILMPLPSEKTLKELSKTESLRMCNLKRNPLDLLGDALPDRYEAAIEAMLSQPDIKGLLVIQGMQIMTQPLENAKIIVRLSRHFPHKPIVCCFAGQVLVEEAVSFLEKNKIPNYSDPEHAVKALNNLIIR